MNCPKTQSDADWTSDILSGWTEPHKSEAIDLVPRILGGEQPRGLAPSWLEALTNVAGLVVRMREGWSCKSCVNTCKDKNDV